MRNSAELSAADIRNILGVMRSIDFGDVSEEVLPFQAWGMFAAKPADVFPRLSDRAQNAITDVINKRMSRHHA